MFSLGGCLKSGRGRGHLFEYFVVVGLSTNEDIPASEIGQPREPKILYVYPEDKAPFVDTNIKNFCFPNGVMTKGLSRRESATDVSTVLYGSLQQLETAENSFVFLITDETLLYGVCVYSSEMVNDAGSLISTTASSEPVLPTSPPTLPRLAFKRGIGKIEVVAKRCYCIVSKFPFFNLHFDILYSVLASDRLYRIQRIHKLYDKNATDYSPAQVVQLLKAYYDQPVPGAGETLKFRLPNEVRDIEFLCPPLDDITSLADWKGRTLVLCQDLGILSAIAISIIPMLRPLVWQGILIPILPNIMLDCLDAPVPIILGLQSLPTERSQALSEFLIVDVDNNSCQLPICNFEQLPQRKALEAALEPYHKRLYVRHCKSKRPLNPCRTTPEELEIVRQITRQFHNYVDKFLGTFRAAIIERNVDISASNFDTKIKHIIPMLPIDFKKFAKLFFETQQFNFYSEQFISSIIKQREEDKQAYQLIVSQLKREDEELQQMEAKMRTLSILTSNGRTEREKLDKLIKASKAKIAELERTSKAILARNPGLLAEISKESNSLDVVCTRERNGSFIERLFGLKR